MTHARNPGKEKIRNLKYRQKRFAIKYVFSHSYFDRQIIESVNRISFTALHNMLREQFPEQPILINTPELIEGEILSDSRGRGTFQQYEPIIT